MVYNEFRGGFTGFGFPKPWAKIHKAWRGAWAKSGGLAASSKEGEYCNANYPYNHGAAWDDNSNEMHIRCMAKTDKDGSELYGPFTKLGQSQRGLGVIGKATGFVDTNVTKKDLESAGKAIASGGGKAGTLPLTEAEAEQKRREERSVGAAATSAFKGMLPFLALAGVGFAYTQMRKGKR